MLYFSEVNPPTRDIFPHKVGPWMREFRLPTPSGHGGRVHATYIGPTF